MSVIRLPEVPIWKMPDVDRSPTFRMIEFFLDRLSPFHFEDYLNELVKSTHISPQEKRDYMKRYESK